ncbi:hypothetical protein ABN028_19860 [Actinopolymorpha sp. B17G11]|uniref:hypothetical protein n=1 Tax=Actinopolymorpha sp. B17G11 TaxID=3160861 RepID=UPI0032E3D3DA
MPKPLTWIDGQDDGEDYKGGPITTNAWYENALIFPGLLLLTAGALYYTVPDVRANVDTAIAFIGALTA